MKVMFYEVDNGPGGMSWEMHTDDGYIRTYDQEEPMVKDSALLKSIGHDIRFYTQAELNLIFWLDLILDEGLDDEGGI